MSKLPKFHQYVIALEGNTQDKENIRTRLIHDESTQKISCQFLITDTHARVRIGGEGGVRVIFGGVFDHFGSLNKIFLDMTYMAHLNKIFLLYLAEEIITPCINS